MRHLWSLLAGVVVAPLTWCLVALGENGSQEKVGAWVSARRWDTTDLIEPAVYLAVAGILVGLVATLRISPVGPLVAGLLLVAAYVGLFISPLDVREAVPDNWEIYDRHLPLLTPLDNGTLALIGALLVMAVFSADRWRRWPAPAAAAGSAAEPAPSPQPAAEPVPVAAASTEAGTARTDAEPADRPTEPPTEAEPAKQPATTAPSPRN
ncbi:MAG: hypothetical protein IRZ05_10140, partial [Micromonosporaceae bacterium]|nr:hypothetical protein [Micromonosporaceae bacterium]